MVVPMNRRVKMKHTKEWRTHNQIQTYTEDKTIVIRGTQNNPMQIIDQFQILTIWSNKNLLVEIQIRQAMEQIKTNTTPQAK